MQFKPEKLNNDNELTSLMKDVSEKAVVACENYLADNPALKEKYLKRFSDAKNSVAAIHDLARRKMVIADLERWKVLFENKNRFIERVEEIKEREDVWKRITERVKTNPLATPEELEAGVYGEELESQVRGAVFRLQEKGYCTFESGFAPNGTQMIGMYDKGLKIPQWLTTHFKERGIRIDLSEGNDRTRIDFIPETDRLITLHEWKELLDAFATMMPDSKSHEYFDGKGNLPIHNAFAVKQEKIRNGENVRLGYGYAFVNGESVPMSDQEFKEKFEGR